MITEKGLIALAQITMCARQKCDSCIFRDKLTHKECDVMISENLQIIYDAMAEGEEKNG